MGAEEEGCDGLRPLRGGGEELEPHDWPNRMLLAVLFYIYTQ